ncbi:MAG: rubredoxin [Pseudomonadota bacterium]
MEVWQCEGCGLIYDEVNGCPDKKIAPGTDWAKVPDYWVCPDCGVSKSGFKSIPIQEYLDKVFS